MESCCCGVGIGRQVPDFTIDTFDPSKGDFGTISLKDQMKSKKMDYSFFLPG